MKTGIDLRLRFLLAALGLSTWACGDEGGTTLKGGVDDLQPRILMDTGISVRLDTATPDIPLIEDCDDGETRACGQGEGECLVGVQTCVGQLWAPACVGEVAPQTERCNGLDDDCDGTADDGFGVGIACKTLDEFGQDADGVTACDPVTELSFCLVPERCDFDLDADGVIACDDCDDSNREVNPFARELCDGLDNDCDGHIDTPFDLGSPCFEGQGICRRGGTSVCADDGALGCSAIPDPPEPEERCGDEDDEDCDGRIDEGYDLGAECGAGAGECLRIGVFTCGETGFDRVCDAVPAVVVEERCGNLLDDDCDGEVDEDFPLGEACTEGVGECAREGVYFCHPDLGSAECSAIAVASRAEACGNGLDEDCDGQTDEGFDVGVACTAGIGLCVQVGVVECTPNGRGTQCSATSGLPEAELCGTLADEDCDGGVDEGFDIGALCTAGVGECRRQGIFECSANRQARRCTAEPVAPGLETCNGLDDDCDEHTDEGFDVGGACDSGIGACRRAGQVACDVNGGLYCTALQAPAGPERCGNLADDDCDGRTDEGFGIGDVCSTGIGGCARNGRSVCEFDGLRTRCDATPGMAVGEVCGNGIDDDCDDRTDEAFDVGAVCVVGSGACRRSGSRICAVDGGSTECNVDPGLASDEVCGTLIDEDCDGRTDEGFSVGSACTVGAGECFRRGSLICSADGRTTRCDAVIGQPRAELCDRLDNDCDTRLDETFDVGLACSIGAANCRTEGSRVCAANGLGTVCDAPAPPPRLELCNEIDDDCDTRVDEDYPFIDEVCDVADDADLCALGYWACNVASGAAVCTDDTPVVEVCDYQDNDCDGVTDNGIDLLNDEDNCGGCGEVCPTPFGRCRQGMCYREYWVDGVAGSNANGDGSRLTPWRTLTHATRTVRGPRAAIMVLPATYSAAMHATEFEIFPVVVPNAVEITGVGTISQIILDPAHAAGALSVVDCLDSSTLVERLTLTRGGVNNGNAGAITARNSDVTFRDLTVQDSRARFQAAALEQAEGHVTIDHCFFYDNISQGAGATVVTSSGELDLLRSHFRDNVAGVAGDAEGVVQCVQCTMRISNTSIIESSGNAVLSHFSGSHIYLTNNTLANNGGSGIFLRDRATGTFYNNITAHNGRYGFVEETALAEPTIMTANLFFGNALGHYVNEGNFAPASVLNTALAIDNSSLNIDASVDGDPRFFSLAAGNVRLTANSAAIDRANLATSPAVDQDNRARPRGNGADIGAFEF